MDSSIASECTAIWSPVIYDELRRMARGYLVGEREGHTLQPTALAHEVWLRLRSSRNAGELAHGAFLGLAAQAMRRILTEHARRRSALRRGAGTRTMDLTVAEEEVLTDQAEAEALALDLDHALLALKERDEELVRLVELRFYIGLNTEEIATALNTSTRTVKRRWRFARAWLQQQLQGRNS